MRIWIEELGGIRHKWCQCSDGISRCLGEEKDSDEIIKMRACFAVARAERLKKIEEDLRALCPEKQIFQGFLPCDDTEWQGKGSEYMYVLKDRKRHGKYQVLQAVNLA